MNLNCKLPLPDLHKIYDLLSSNCSLCYHYIFLLSEMQFKMCTEVEHSELAALWCVHILLASAGCAGQVVGWEVACLCRACQ